MKSKTRTKVVVERYRREVHQAGPAARQEFCPRCGLETAFATAPLAASMAEIGLRRMFQLVESDELHSRDLELNTTWICIESLTACLGDREI